MSDLEKSDYSMETCLVVRLNGVTYILAPGVTEYMLNAAWPNAATKHVLMKLANLVVSDDGRVLKHPHGRTTPEDESHLK